MIGSSSSTGLVLLGSAATAHFQLTSFNGYPSVGYETYYDRSTRNLEGRNFSSMRLQDQGELQF